MIIIATGVTGSRRADYVKEVVEIAKKEGKNIDYIDIGPEMFRKADQLRVDIPVNKILDLDPLALGFLRATTFEEVLGNIDQYKDGDKDLIISLHASFRWRKVLLPAFDFYYFREIKPDFYVTIINSVHNILENIQTKEDLMHWRERLTLKEILIWQDEEIFTTKTIADFQGVPHYIVSGSDIPETLYKIIYDVEKAKKEGREVAKKAYLSYPMTMIRKSREVTDDKNKLLKQLRNKGIIIFDPATVEDMILVDLLEESGSELEVPELSITIPRNEVEEAKQYIIEQTVVRDYRLIDQSDMVIVFYPVKELSAGVLSEMIYAFTHQKDVYAYFPHRMSPFFQYYSTKVFEDKSKLVRYLSRI
jgi:adenylate kinase